MNRLANVFLLVSFGLFFNSWAQQLSGRAVRGRSETRSRIAGISVYQWKQNAENQVKKALTKIIGNGSVDGLNPFQKRQLTNHQRRLVNRMPSMGGEIDLGTYYPTDEGAPIRYRPPNTGKIYKKNQNWVFILKVLPDVTAKYDVGELIVLVNRGPYDADLTGWYLRDKVEPQIQRYGLKGTIPTSGAGTRPTWGWRTREFDISGDDLRMNNDGDIIYLVDDKGITRDTFSYSEAEVGVDRWIVRSKNRLKSLK